MRRHKLRDVLASRAPMADAHYADIRATLERSGTPIGVGVGSHDRFIAAHARSRGMTLLTRSRREFLRVPGLTVDDWPTKAWRRLAATSRWRSTATNCTAATRW